MVDLPQGPAGPPEKPVVAAVVTDPLARPRQDWPPPPVKPIEGFLEFLPVFLVCCGILASAVLFLNGFTWVTTGWREDWLNSEADHQGLYFIGLAFFVGPMLFGIAGILHRMNQKKRD